jgi:hypothetical protein
MPSVLPTLVSGDDDGEPSHRDLNRPQGKFALLQAGATAIGCASWVPFMRILVAGIVATALLIALHLAGVPLPRVGIG